MCSTKSSLDIAAKQESLGRLLTSNTHMLSCRTNPTTTSQHQYSQPASLEPPRLTRRTRESRSTAHRLARERVKHIGEGYRGCWLRAKKTGNARHCGCTSRASASVVVSCLVPGCTVCATRSGSLATITERMRAYLYPVTTFNERYWRLLHVGKVENLKSSSGCKVKDTRCSSFHRAPTHLPRTNQCSMPWTSECDDCASRSICVLIAKQGKAVTINIIRTASLGHCAWRHAPGHAGPCLRAISMCVVCTTPSDLIRSSVCAGVRWCAHASVMVTLAELRTHCRGRTCDAGVADSCRGFHLVS